MCANDTSSGNAATVANQSVTSQKEESIGFHYPIEIYPFLYTYTKTTNVSITQQPTNSVNKKSVSFNCDTISRIWTENVGFPRAQVHHTEVHTMLSSLAFRRTARTDAPPIVTCITCHVK